MTCMSGALQESCGTVSRQRSCRRCARPCQAPLLRWLILAACAGPLVAQRAFKLSDQVCEITEDTEGCQTASIGDAALKIKFTGGGPPRTLTLDMKSETSCSATAYPGGGHCPQVYFIESTDNTGNAIQITRCSYYKQVDYSSHSLSYTFINIGTYFPFIIKDDHGYSRAVVPPGAMRECLCYCYTAPCHIANHQRLFCTSTISPGSTYSAPR
mmetsp:Transcript_110485/g.195548  ORF Transcript_110485/g.195548 Transcript_110485/m.195548 type:complete len:213 (-) Transcript_110485:119-757(-)